MTEQRDAIIATKYIKRTGNSFAVYLTNEIKVLGLNEGDPIQIIIKKVDE